MAGFYDPEGRAREKQRSRDDDARALANGEKTSEQLRRENSLFCDVDVKLNLDEADLW